MSLWMAAQRLFPIEGMGSRLHAPVYAVFAALEKKFILAFSSLGITYVAPSITLSAPDFTNGLK
jgi:hypothetical protein